LYLKAGIAITIATRIIATTTTVTTVAMITVLLFEFLVQTLPTPTTTTKRFPAIEGEAIVIFWHLLTFVIVSVLGAPKKQLASIDWIV